MDAPAVQYARTSDGVSLAYAVHGAGPALLYTRGGGHLELEWQVRESRNWFERLGDSFTVVRFDYRGSGMSDRDGPNMGTFYRDGDAHVVLDALGFDRVGVLGAHTAGAFRSVLTLGDLGGRASAAVLWGAPGLFGSDFVHSELFRHLAGIGELDRELYYETLHLWQGWEQPDSRAMRSRMREASGIFDQMDDFVRNRDAAAARAAAVVEQLETPVLLVVRDGTRMTTTTEVDALAKKMKNAQRKTLSGRGILPELGDIEEAAAVVEQFLLPRVEAPAPRIGKGRANFQTILFTDVVASTPLLTQLRDERMREVMRDHDTVCEAAITQNDGRVVKTIGDAFMAEFGAPSAAIEAAIAIQRGIRERFSDSELAVHVRIGINAGEPIVEGDDLHGTSVVIAKRLESEADADGILVSDVVRHAVAGRNFTFEDRGPVTLKGLDEPIRAWAVRWDE